MIDPAPRPAVLTPFEDALDAYRLSYRDIPGPAPFPMRRLTLQPITVLLLAFLINSVLPRPRSQGHKTIQALSAALARSRMR